jgi:hypothetical protein
MDAWDDLPPEEKLRTAYRAATEDMSVAYVKILRSLPPGVRIGQAFGLWRVAMAALVRQELRKGLAPDEARRAAARRMLQVEHEETA